MKKTAILLMLITLIIQGCVTTPTPQGSLVQIVERKSDSNCKLIDIINANASDSFGVENSAKNALNAARNKAAEIGGNGIRILNIDDGPFSSSSIAAEVLRCEFN